MHTGVSKLMRRVERRRGYKLRKTGVIFFKHGFTVAEKNIEQIGGANLKLYCVLFLQQKELKFWYEYYLEKLKGNFYPRVKEAYILKRIYET